MPLVEGSGGPPRQPEEPNKEQEKGSFYIASRFKNELAAKLSYQQAQQLIFHDRKADLSVYRFLLEQVSHVAVVGTPHYERLQGRLEKILSYGEPSTLPDEVVNALHQRRARMKQQGDWVEGHYRPGKKLDY